MRCARGRTPATCRPPVSDAHHAHARGSRHRWSPVTILLGGVVRRFVATARPLSSPLAESTMVCFGITARLALVRTEDRAVAAPTAMVRNAHWRLALDVPADFLAVEEMKVSLDVFTIRGNQAVRDDLVTPRSSGQPGPSQWKEWYAYPRRQRSGAHSRLDSDRPWQLWRAGHHLRPYRSSRRAKRGQPFRGASQAMPSPTIPQPRADNPVRHGRWWGGGHRGYGSRLHTKHLPSPKSAKSSSGSAPRARSSASVPM